MVRRLFEGEKLWKSHRTHFYQRWANSGVRHSTVCLWIHCGGAVLIYIPLGVLSALGVNVTGRASVAIVLSLGYLFALRKLVPRRFGVEPVTANDGNVRERREVSDSIAQE